MTEERQAHEFERWSALFGLRLAHLLGEYSKETGQHPGKVLVTATLLDLCRLASDWADEQIGGK